MTKNEHALVIGGSSGIGLATAQRLLADGMRVTITGRDKNRLEAAQAGLKGDIATAQFDAADDDQANAFFDKVGAFDHLVLALGSGRGFGPFRDVDLADVRLGFDEKVWPQLHCAQAASRKIRSDGSITFISAVTAQMAMPGTSGIAAANGVLTTVTPVLAIDLKPLRVNAVCPGVIDTPWWGFLPEDQRQAVFADYAGKSTVGRVGTAADVAESIAFLVRDSFVTGLVLICDGGLRLAA